MTWHSIGPVFMYNQRLRQGTPPPPPNPGVFIFKTNLVCCCTAAASRKDQQHVSGLVAKLHPKFETGNKIQAFSRYAAYLLVVRELLLA